MYGMFLPHILLQLCATKFGREYLRAHQTYFVLRELHRVEEEAEVGGACETAIHMLIADEPAPGMENLEEVDIPQDFAARYSAITELRDETSATAEQSNKMSAATAEQRDETSAAEAEQRDETSATTDNQRDETSAATAEWRNETPACTSLPVDRS